MTRTTLLLVCLLVSSILAQPPGDATAKLQGLWLATEMLKGDQAAPKDALAKTTLVIQGDRFTFTSPDMSQEGTLKVDGKTLDLVTKEGKTVLCRFEATDDTLRIAAKHDERPAEVKAGDGIYIALKRALSHPVSGLVTLNGKPLRQAVLTFHGEVAATGETADDGTYRLGTRKPGDGAPAGEYVITIAWPERDEKGGVKADGKDRLQGRYADPKTSALKVIVAPGSNAFRFDLATK